MRPGFFYAAVKLQLHSSLDTLDPQQWDALVRHDYPFLKHAFLAGLERHGCVGEPSGWLPRHLVCVDAAHNLIGALPMYEKHNSWGEFVFDHAWADAFHRMGLDYYPKLVCAIPFTPASGQRLLAVDAHRHAVVDALLNGAREVLEQGGFSGLHALFVDAVDYAALAPAKRLVRIDCQFHWHNQGYADFDAFLATLKAKKRKNIRQERRKVQQAGIVIRCLDGHTARRQDWVDFVRLYRKIYQRKYGAPAFNLHFFRQLATKLPQQILLVLAHSDATSDATCLAAALMYRDQTTLYGRHWGCDGYFDSLHFEVCYYQGIEYCIKHGLQRFDPGAQGEHKIARGFLPTATRSLHWMRSSGFNHALSRFVAHEQAAVNHYIAAAQQHSPYLDNV